MKRVYLAADNLPDAQIAVDTLATQGIKAHIFNANAVGVLGELAATQIWPEVRVEDKYDGIRAQLHRSGHEVRLYSRDLRDVSSQFPEVVEGARRLPWAGMRRSASGSGRPCPSSSSAPGRTPTRCAPGTRRAPTTSSPSRSITSG